MPNKVQSKPWANYYATLRFLTILPTPKTRKNLAPQVAMFPLVGLTLGLLLYTVSLLFSALQPAVAAFIILLAWLISTGFLHLDGLADLADGIGASHHHPERFLEVMKQPNIGAFAVITLILLILGKFVLLMTLAWDNAWAALLLIPAWARLGAAWWVSSLPALSDGLAAWCKNTGNINLTTWFILLFILSLIFQPILILAPLLLWAWKVFLSKRFNGMNGDCLGAGIEICELGLLFLCCVNL